MKLNSYFKDFLTKISLSENQISRIKTTHETLRDRLNKDENLSKKITGTFLQGSYKRYTAIRPKNNEKSDVDIVVVLNLDKYEIEPNKVFNEFRDFLDEYYDDKYTFNNKSIRISLTDIDVDLVITLPIDSSNDFDKDFFNKSIKEFNDEEIDSDEIKKGYLYLPNVNENTWIKINPTAQIINTTLKNKKTNGLYIKVVKSIKWWQRFNYPNLSVKSYILERFIFECCPNDITCVSEGIYLTFQNMTTYNQKPYLNDFSLKTNVFENISDEEYDEFYSKVCEASEISKQAYLEEDDADKSIRLWTELFGSVFDDSETNKNSGFTRPNKKASVPSGRFA